MCNRQMELDLAKVNYRRNGQNRPSVRAQWWFERMRAVVDQAMEDRPLTQPPRLRDALRT